MHADYWFDLFLKDWGVRSRSYETVASYSLIDVLERFEIWLYDKGVLRGINKQKPLFFDELAILTKLANGYCDGDCDTELPHEKCRSCKARSVINEIGYILGKGLTHKEEV